MRSTVQDKVLRHLPRPTDILLCKACKFPGMENAAVRIALGSLVDWRESEVYSHHKTPDPDILSSADDSWIRSILTSPPQGDATRIAYALGYCEAGSPISSSMKRLGNDDILSEVISKADQGAFDSVKRQIEGDTAVKQEVVLRTEIQKVCDTLGRSILRAAFHDLDRKSLMRQINAMILLEEAVQYTFSSAGDGSQRRKTSIENALMRLFNQIGTFPDKSMEQITQVFRTTGRASRLNNAISDGLDRLQAYASASAMDPDRIEAGRAAGRPAVESMANIRTAARQSRLFRDRERV
jgi:hypothetical protein